ncbi:MAG: methionyl-tRNA formyltransferase [Acidimicrobiaceae bacterium]|nr:methionyl-tRNA formyltransferase [Acidimicrobiaceae bacterium]MDE0516425.1 methionyl-tRNA formyltransferase [Acidimicrobiaceae bacterium]MDE0657591.1 methionyl-tRNA formyltransferase [Acidimicrobiaceae bacterium]MXZ95631.1 methionyl-tRNA formyltransferase [Acidimicrobiaceae bacterium]MYF42512.1 methionyl-tRNA formyltransferase [Acidimicrobiaceae bacterium]
MSATPPERRRIVYFGTPEVAVPPVQALYRAGHDVALVVTRPPKRRGRRQAPTPSPVAAAAAEMGLAVTCDLSDALHVEADLGIVVAYGEHIPDELLERRRTVNLHFSLLPRWRGAAPVERAILAGDTETGVCLMDVASEIDTGAVYRRAATPIEPQESATELRDRLCELGIGLMLDALSEGFGDPVPQSGEMTWADKMSPSELRVDWSVPAEHVLRLVRVGGAWTTYRDRRLKVLEARLATGNGQPAAAGTISLVSRSGDGPAPTVATGRGAVELLTVQSEGRAAAPARDWANGARIAGGERFE